MADPLLADRLTMIPGTRSLGADTHDQQNVTTPELAMLHGATWLVIGRQITKSTDPAAAFQAVAAEMQSGIDARKVVMAASATQKSTGSMPIMNA